MTRIWQLCCKLCAVYKENKKNLESNRKKTTRLIYETTNLWKLVVALKGAVAESLQTVPEVERNNYRAVMAALQRKYGSKHRKQVFRMELKNRSERVGEVLPSSKSRKAGAHGIYRLFGRLHRRMQNRNICRWHSWSRNKTSGYHLAKTNSHGDCFECIRMRSCFCSMLRCGIWNSWIT